VTSTTEAPAVAGWQDLTRLTEKSPLSVLLAETWDQGAPGREHWHCRFGNQ
jgi:hypothetical protein